MADDSPVINLKILSPSTDVKGDILFLDIPASTKVKDLRLRIQTDIESRPALDRMRLIYRGRVVANDEDTLGDVFGIENVRSSKDQTLHLVLRELHANTSSTPSPAPRSSTAPPNPFRPPAQNPPRSPLATNPFRSIPQPRPNSQPQTPHTPPHHHHFHHHHHPLPQQHHQNPFGHLPVPPVMNNLLQQQVAQAIAQNQPQNDSPGGSATDQQSRDGMPGPGEGPRASPVPLRPGIAPNLMPNTTRTIRQEGIGPNGERWTVTWNNTNFTIPLQPNAQPGLPRPFPHAPAVPPQNRPSPGPSERVDQLMAQTHLQLESARREMDNVVVLLQEPHGQASQAGSQPFTGPPQWRFDRMRFHMQLVTNHLNHLQQSLAVLLADPAMAQSPGVASLQHTMNQIRNQANSLNTTLGDLQQLQNDGNSAQASPAQNTPAASTASSNTDLRPPAPQSESQQGTTTISPVNTSHELFILSSPQGPVGILFDQRGTYTTAPMAPTLPFQAFTQQFTTNRHLVARMGQQMAAAGVQPVANQAQNQNQNQNQDQNQGRPVIQEPAQADQQDRIGVIAGHAWLLIKLAAFIYFFAGSGGWYRPIMLGIIAAVVYLTQLGIFENQFNRVRHYFEALLPLAHHHGQGRDQPVQNTNEQVQRQGAQVNSPTPEAAAQRLVQRHQERQAGWARDAARTVERGFALFVASLFPGVGERMVREQEERARAARAAEEQRQREEDERRQQEEAQQAELNQDEDTEAKSDATPDGPLTEAPSSSSKGKEKASAGSLEGSS